MVGFFLDPIKGRCQEVGCVLSDENILNLLFARLKYEKKFHQNPFVIKATLKSTNKTNIIFCNLDKIGLSDNEAGRALRSGSHSD